MIITISGAGCTGKTTLLNHIKSQNPYSRGNNEIHYHGEYIRNIFESHYKNKYPSFEELLANPMDVINIHKETARLFNEVLWSSDLNEIHVFDRSPLDISIYLYMNLMNCLDPEKYPEIFQKYLEASKYIHRCASDFMNHNPILFYTRPFSSEIENDGFRPVSLIERRGLELALFDKEFLSLPGVHVLPSNLEERINMINSILDKRDS